MAQRKGIQLGTMRLHCHELWCRLQMQLGSCVAAAIALIRPLAWEPPYAAGVALEKTKRQLKKKRKKENRT